MRLISLLTCFVAFLAPLAAATNLIKSTALNVCMQSSNFTATYFSVVFYPGNSTLDLSFNGLSAITGFVKAEITLTAYGYQAYQSTIDPCTMKQKGLNLCPMHAGPLPIPQMNVPLPPGTASKIPSKSCYCVDQKWLPY